MAGRAIDPRLAAYLRNCAGQDFTLGRFDCGIFVADWCVICHGVDPLAALRGRYCTMAGLFALAGTQRLPMIYARLLNAAGLASTAHPEPGDVAVIDLGRSEPVGAIRVAAGFVVVAEGRGLSRVRQARLLRAWSTGGVGA